LPWLNDLASNFGLPVAAVAIAGSIYAALAAAEKVARPEALKEISGVLKDPSWSQSVRPSSIVEKLFIWTYGKRHLGLKCISRSVSATLIMVSLLIVLKSRSMGSEFLLDFTITIWRSPPFAMFLITSSFIPDYLALWKTRRILRLARNCPAILALGIDAVYSIAISIVFLYLSVCEWYTIHQGLMRGLHFLSLSPLAPFALASMANPIAEFREITSNDALPYFAFYFSTLFTSVWIALVVAASTIIKLFAPLLRWTPPMGPVWPAA
jgi:hypothetical protein